MILLLHQNNYQNLFKSFNITFFKSFIDLYQVTFEEKWMELAKNTSYKQFANEVPGGAELLAKALAVK